MTRLFPAADTPALREHAQHWVDAPGEAAVPRLAATVMCLRDGDDGLEVFVLHRVSTMAFAASMHVFPGGGVDPRDGDPTLAWAGPSPAEWAERMATDERSARVLVAAAVREVFEETGVLLAGPRTGAARLLDVSGDPWQRARAALVAHETSMAEVLCTHDLALRTDLLAYRAHWTTPEFEPRRYDTRFFAARLPEGQAADGRTSEAQAASWVRPQSLLDAMRAGEARMLPPTIVSLEQLAAAGSVAAALAQPHTAGEVMPRLVERPDGFYMEVDLP